MSSTGNPAPLDESDYELSPARGGIPAELRVARVILILQAVLFIPAGLSLLAALRSSTTLLPRYALLPLGCWLLVSGLAVTALALRIPRLSRVDRLVISAIEVGCVGIGIAFAGGVGLGWFLFLAVLYELWIPRPVRAAYSGGPASLR